MKQVVPALRMLLVLTVLTGLVYPLAMTGLSQSLFHEAASGSLLMRDGKVVGSRLLGQKFEGAGYFRSRPSAVDYNPLPSGGSNFGPISKKLKDQVVAQREKAGGSSEARVPEDLLFASASGLDPHISPDAALYQVDRVAVERGLSEDEKNSLKKLVAQHTEGRQFGIFGEPRVNVLELNLALDETQKARTR